MVMVMDGSDTQSGSGYCCLASGCLFTVKWIYLIFILLWTACAGKGKDLMLASIGGNISYLVPGDVILFFKWYKGYNNQVDMKQRIWSLFPGEISDRISEMYSTNKHFLHHICHRRREPVHWRHPHQQDHCGTHPGRSAPAALGRGTYNTSDFCNVRHSEKVDE